MAASYCLKLDIKSYWHPGTGKGSGSHVDAVVEKDRFGCPFISGRMLKGLLRDAVYRLLQWKVIECPQDFQPENVVEQLFGSRAYENQRPRDETIPGIIRLSDAVMEDCLRQWLIQDDCSRSVLFRDIYSTAIDAEKGVARQGSLRGIQVVVPVELNARLDIIPLIGNSEPDDKNWYLQHAEEIIKTALPLIRAVGANRTRGLGRAVLSLKEIK
ncbi:CRISPR/Cas system CSM-associated protein Csm3, group 7 of RAMP superfamily [Nitrosomonas marina]|uniref:CRISPR/Cas system CSM-associated protein Csm3, group 7 of RAMP superfamily n=1 Tax=Nitrosomonas marina TaxID=917 RepID=A0A1I0GAP7_9PROT|nr:RAMP superfamily CRISPR-associated protein [Nitrosomonas marina]SET68122.1 CRISPR/Cas system CSM-associated protein Csm3, group 7 of RAMP superfamily [Nitrosomonas marina]